MGKCPSLVQKRGNKRYTLMVSCPSCYAGVEQRIHQEPVTHKEPACLKWIMPKPPKGRKTPIQRSEYYGWHLILESNLRHNNVSQPTIDVLKRIFYKQVKPSKQQYQALVESFSSKRPTLVVRTLISQMIKDIATVKEYSIKAGFSQRAQKLFKLHCDEFVKSLVELQKFE